MFIKKVLLLFFNKNLVSLIKKLVLVLSLILVLLIIITILVLYKIFLKQKNKLYINIKSCLDSLTNNHKNYMNYGLWDSNTLQLTDANKNLCRYVLKKGDFKNSKRILDVGCGLGEQDIYWIKHITGKITCIDICEELINRADKLVKKKNLQNRIEVEQGNACKLKYDDKSFDTVISLESAFHYNERSNFLKESYRVLEDDGKLVLADLLIPENKIDIFNSKFQEIFIKLMDIPKANLKTPNELKEELEEIGYEVEMHDITDRTFKPFYKFFFENYNSDIIFNNIVNKFFVNFYINNICNGTTGFKYIVAVCKKKISPQ